MKAPLLLPMITEPTSAAKAVFEQCLKNQANYKLPTSHVLIKKGDKMLEQVAYCLDFYLGGHEEIDLGDYVKVQSQGYYHYIGA